MSSKLDKRPIHLEHPECDLESISYRGYFENKYGEQWVILYDHDARKGLLFGGDIGWENPIAFKHADFMERTKKGYGIQRVFNDIMLSESEDRWLTDCLCAIYYIGNIKDSH